MSITNKRLIHTLIVGLSAFVLSACDNDDDSFVPPPTPPPPPPMVSYHVTVSNLSNAQPLSPIAVIAHHDAYSVFTVGAPATDGLEILAEGGDNSMLIAEAGADMAVAATASGTAPIGPAGSEGVRITLLESALPGLQISVSTMLVNTNDAITGINGTPVADMQPGDRLVLRTIAYDAGTEANSEQAIHIPGPAGGGEGFNAARDDRADRVTMHSGVVGQDDGFPTSDLNSQHRFDNPVAEVLIERIS